MFEEIAKEIYSYSISKLKNSPPFFSYKYLSEMDLHPAIIKYISAELDFMIYEDRQNLLRNSVFDYSGEKISEHFNAIANEIKQTKRFSSEHIKKLIKYAVNFNLYFISQPNKTLLKFLFGKGNHKTTDEIRQILNYTFYYNYLIKIILAYLDKKKIISISYNEMKQLLEKIDILSAGSDKENLIDSAFYAIDDFFNIDETLKKTINLKPFQNFLRDKNLSEEIEKIENEIFTSDEEFTLEEIKKILFGYDDDLEDDDILENIETESKLEDEEILDIDEASLETEIEESEIQLEEEPIDENEFKEDDELTNQNSEEAEDNLEPLIEELPEEETLFSNIEFEEDKTEEQLDETKFNNSENFEFSEEETIEDFSEQKTAENIFEETSENKTSTEPDEEKTFREINVTSLLEDKKASKLVENIFEYDMEEFSALIERIEKSPNKEEALAIIDDYGNSLSTKKPKEIEQFKEIISHYL